MNPRPSHICFAALTILLLVPQAVAQTSPRPQFDVVSIKPVKLNPGQRPQFVPCASGGPFLASGMPLKLVIEWAYDLRNDFAVPDWAGLRGELYQIEAKGEGSVSAAQCRAMGQALLEDRFHLKVHHESKEMPVYAMVLTKGGSKLHEIKLQDGPGDGVWMQGRRASSRPWDLFMIAATLSGLPGVGRPVVDRTGLNGQYEFHLEFSEKPDDQRPDIFTALQEQLGLQLQPTRAPVDQFIVDQLERPSEN